MDYPFLKEQMPDTIKKVWRLRTIVSFVIFCLLFTIAYLFLQYQNWLFSWVLFLWMGLFALTILAHLLSLAMIRYRYKFHRYEIQDNDIAIQSGYFFRKTTYIPIRRIQHIETDQGILLRRFNLISLQINTAATDHTIEGLTVAQADLLRKQIMDLVRVVKNDL